MVPSNDDMILTLLQDVKASLDSLDKRLTNDMNSIRNDVSRLERGQVRHEAQIAARDEQFAILRDRIGAMVPREELSIRYASRDEMETEKTTRFRFALPLFLGVLVGLPGYISLLVDRL